MAGITRLELHNVDKNSHKYYEFHKAGNVYQIYWGRCLGRDTNGGHRTETADVAMELMRQKMRKGYVPS